MSKPSYRAVAMIAVLVIVMGTGTMAFADDIGILVNHVPVETDAAARIVGGHVVGPIAPVARAMGAQVQWEPCDRNLYINTAQSPWFGVGECMGSMDWPESPYGFNALGSILRVRHYLSEIQWTSLNKAKDRSSSVLARFEIINAFNDDWGYGATPGLAQADNLADPGFAWQGFTVRVILYWVSLDMPEGQPPGTARFYRGLPLPEGAVAKSQKLQALEQELKADYEESLRDPGVPPGTPVSVLSRFYGYSGTGLWHGGGVGAGGAWRRRGSWRSAASAGTRRNCRLPGPSHGCEVRHYLR